MRHLAETMPRHGIAVLLHDRRPSVDGDDVPLDVQAADALAVAADLRKRVGDVPIGMWGWSQGAWAAALAASMDRSVCFLVVVGSVGVTPAAQMRHGTAEHLRRAGFGEEDVAELLDVRAIYEAGLRGDADAAEVQRRLEDVRTRPWWELAWLPERFSGVGSWRDLDFDPELAFAASACPVLAVWGDDDPWVPVEASEAAWRRAANERLTVLRLPRTGHAPDPEDRQYEDALVAHVRRSVAAWRNNS
jgi:pimeloyl-ACP methyl ester carboxylesterase